MKKIKNWLFRPVKPKLKTRFIFSTLCAIALYSIIISFFVHWAFALIPLLLIALVLYVAKIPVKEEPKNQSKVGFKNYGKKKK